MNVEGKIEAFSMRKRVIKVNGEWYRFDDTTANVIANAEKGTVVKLDVLGRKIRAIEIIEQEKKREVKNSYEWENGDVSEELKIRMSALKHAVQLCTAYKVKDTGELLEIAEQFALWLEGENAEPIPLSVSVDAEEREKEKKKEDNEPIEAEV